MAEITLCNTFSHFRDRFGRPLADGETVSKHAAVRFPSASVLHLISRFGCSGRRRWTVRCAVPCMAPVGWTKVTQPCCLNHFVPHRQEVVITEDENAVRGVSMGESYCRQGQALAPRTVQLDRVDGRICFGPQRSVFWVKKQLMTGADSLNMNLDVSSLSG